MFNLTLTHPSWKSIIKNALNQMDRKYLAMLQRTDDWLPGAEKIFSAFSIPLHQTKYILFGESPYPRKESANGYAFWDGAVHELWSETGLSKAVNRATSLRNLIKLLLIAENLLSENNVSQLAIAKISKSNLIQTLDELFQNFLNAGFLLLNATPILRKKQIINDSKAWFPFIKSVLQQIQSKEIQLILLGNIAKKIDQLPEANHFKIIHAEHPYNLTFVNNEKIQALLKPLHLIKRFDLAYSNKRHIAIESHNV